MEVGSSLIRQGRSGWGESGEAGAGRHRQGLIAFTTFPNANSQRDTNCPMSNKLPTAHVPDGRPTYSHPPTAARRYLSSPVILTLESWSPSRVFRDEGLSCSRGPSAQVGSAIRKPGSCGASAFASSNGLAFMYAPVAPAQPNEGKRGQKMVISCQGEAARGRFSSHSTTHHTPN